MSTEVRTPGHEDGSMDGNSVASITEDEVTTVLTLVEVGQTLTQGHCWRPEI